MILGIVFFSCSKPSLQLDTYKLDNIINKYVSEDYYPFLHVLVDDKYGQTIYEHSSVNGTAHPELEIDENTHGSVATFPNKAAYDEMTNLRNKHRKEATDSGIKMIYEVIGHLKAVGKS